MKIKQLNHSTNKRASTLFLFDRNQIYRVGIYTE